MKKVLLRGTFVLITVAALASCNKDYTCTCTFDDPSLNVTGIDPSYEILDSPKSDAEAACSASNDVAGVSCSLD